MPAPHAVQINWEPTFGRIDTTHLFNNTDKSDVSIIFKNVKGIPVKIRGHKFVLAMTSPVFNKMFYTVHSSTSMGNNNVVEMTEEKYGFDSMAFFNFIKFLYTGNIAWTELSAKTILGILLCSQLLDVPRLKPEARKGLMSKLNTDNAISLLETALLSKDNDLEEKSLEIIDKSAQTVLKSDAILQAKQQTLFKIIKRRKLAVEESQVLDVCLKWSEKECERKGLALTQANKRQVLGNIFFQIRFPILPPLRIAELVHSNFLTQKESLDMLLQIHCANDVVKDKKGIIPKSPFKTKRRAKLRKRLTAVRAKTPCAQEQGGLLNDTLTVAFPEIEGMISPNVQ